MPMFDFQCSACGSIFEALVRKDEETVRCAECGKKDAKKLLSASSFSIKNGIATRGIEKRVKDYQKTG